MKILEKIEIIQGDPGPTINLGVSGVKSLSGYSCVTKVVDNSGVEVISTRKITEIIVDGTNEAFALNLKASETQILKADIIYMDSRNYKRSCLLQR